MTTRKIGASPILGAPYGSGPTDWKHQTGVVVKDEDIYKAVAMDIAAKQMDVPKYSVGEIVRLGFGPYSLRIDEILVTGKSMYSYRGQIFKDGRPYKYGTISEKAIAY